MQFFASRHAAAIAAVAAAALPPPPSSATNPNGVGLSNSASGLNAPPPIPSTHQHDFHPAYRIPGYMEHLYSLQHASAASSSSLHGKFCCTRTSKSISTLNDTIYWCCFTIGIYNFTPLHVQCVCACWFRSSTKTEKSTYAFNVHQISIAHHQKKKKFFYFSKKRKKNDWTRTYFHTGSKWKSNNNNTAVTKCISHFRYHNKLHRKMHSSRK